MLLIPFDANKFACSKITIQSYAVLLKISLDVNGHCIMNLFKGFAPGLQGSDKEIVGLCSLTFLHL
jgi:hypothetical protein